MKKSVGRPLLMPDEVRRLSQNEGVILVRGEKPLKLLKMTPEEHPDNHKLINIRVNNYLPEWRKKEESKSVTEPKDKSFAENVQLNMNDTAAQLSIFEEQDSIYLDDSETELNPIKIIDLGKSDDCSQLDEVAAADI